MDKEALKLMSVLDLAVLEKELQRFPEDKEGLQEVSEELKDRIDRIKRKEVKK